MKRSTWRKYRGGNPFKVLSEIPPGTVIVHTIGNHPGLAIVTQPGKPPMTVREFDQKRDSDTAG